MRSLSPLLLATLLLATCYNPQLVDGGLRCSPTDECPSGYECKGDRRCYLKGTIPPIGGTGGGGNGGGGIGGVGAVGGLGGVGGIGGIGGGTGGSMGGAGGACTAPMGVYGPFPMCQPQMGDRVCDLVCQAGCPCNQRCKLESGSTLCRAEVAPFDQQYDACDPKADHCRPGLICLQESDSRPICGAHCYRHCRTDNDCPNARCSIEIQFGASSTSNRVCSPPMEACNPWQTAGQPARCVAFQQRPYPTFGCYVMSASYPDTTICDCAGIKKLGEECMFEHECEPGFECVAVTGVRTCRKVCAVGAVGGVASGGCPVPQACNPFPGSNRWGFCR